MTVKEYLEQAARLDERILEEKRTCQELREMAQSLKSPSLQERVDGSQSTEATFVKELEKLADEEKRLEEDIKKMISLKVQIYQVIGQVGEPERRAALRMRYLQGKGFYEIAAALHCNRDTARRWCRQSIRKIILPEDAISLQFRGFARESEISRDETLNVS